MEKLISVTHPPKVDFERELMRRFGEESARDLVRLWHASIVAALRDYSWLDYSSDVFDDLFAAFYQATGVHFRDTLETYTLQKPDGTPWTMADTTEQVERLRAATRGIVPNG